MVSFIGAEDLVVYGKRMGVETCVSVLRMFLSSMSKYVLIVWVREREREGRKACLGGQEEGVAFTPTPNTPACLALQWKIYF